MSFVENRSRKRRKSSRRLCRAASRKLRSRDSAPVARWTGAEFPSENAPGGELEMTPGASSPGTFFPGAFVLINLSKLIELIKPGALFN